MPALPLPVQRRPAQKSPAPLAACGAFFSFALARFLGLPGCGFLPLGCFQDIGGRIIELGLLALERTISSRHRAQPLHLPRSIARFLCPAGLLVEEPMAFQR